MIRRILTSVAAASVLGALISMPAGAGQTSASAKAPADKPARQAYTPPKTSWGDPDIQGSWTTDDVIGVPLQRQATYGDRFNLSDEEFAARVKADEQNRRNNANAIG